VIPDAKEQLLERCSDAQVKEIRSQYDEGLITDGERYNKVVDIWAQTVVIRSPK
jgi:DNA-directed RNA polymerase subunit beta'